MTRTIRIEIAGPRVCGELLHFLGARGLAGRLVETNDRCALEVGYVADPEERLRNDVRDALRDWLAERDTPLVLSEVGEDAYVLRPPGE
jgi:hypothetical protein